MPLDLDSAFLTDILAHPSDRAARLIYADWLDDAHGHAAQVADRVRFIRAQCAHEATDAGDPAHLIALVEANDLLARYGRDWTRGLPGFVRDWQFRAGFVERVTAAPGVLVEHGERLCGLIPLRAISLRQASGGWGKLMRCPLMGRIEALEINSTFQGRTNWLDLLVASPYLGKLRRLGLERNALPDRFAELLGAAERLPVLAELTLGRAAQLGAASADLARSPLAGQVRRLELTLGYHTRYELDALAGGVWPRLERLCLNGSLTGTGVLAAAPWLGQLRALTCRDGSVGDQELFGVLARCPALESLVFANCRLPETPGALPVANWPRLRVLRLGHTRGGAVLAALSARALPPHLHTLEFGGVNLTGTAFGPLLDALHRLPLRTLSLGNCGLHDADLRSLAERPALAKLQRLDLHGNRFTDNGLTALLEAPSLTGLLGLDVSGCPNVTAGLRKQVHARYPYREGRP